MTSKESLTVPYHQQDTDVYCGAACAQMILASIGANLLDQSALYTDARNHTIESGWKNPPDGLQWVLNDRRPAGFGGWFALYSLNTEDAASRKLVWTIHHYQVAPMALVYMGDHWIVVRGYEASAAPASSTDTSYTISAFEVNNPWPPTPTLPVPPPPPPPPHSATDGCGTGGARGVANEHIAYSYWQSKFMTPSKYPGVWNSKYVVVGDPDPPAERPGQMPPAVLRPSGEALLDPKAAIDRALAGLRQYGLQDRKGWSKALKGTKPGIPFLVQHLDQMDSFYFIVPLEARKKMATAAVAVDARFGDYQECIALPENGSGLLTPLDEKTIRGMVVGRRLDLEEGLGRLLVRKEAFSLYPVLVWRPCLESLSPFYPFHMITVGDQRIYIRVDGRLFTALHTNIPGI